MASNVEIRVMQKRQLHTLLIIKKHNQGTVLQLQEALVALVAEMEQEDVAYVEKVVGVKAL